MLEQHEGIIALVLHQPVAARATGFLFAGAGKNIKTDQHPYPFYLIKIKAVKTFFADTRVCQAVVSASMYQLSP